ncbi:protealysin inhibitor emfourin [Actinomadura sp. WMMA1423]|uniref:protealysin inhibitor emfourin n=1 Tax=Actinomadura sp. WMMA1423 TaxID=2591108 RepID=UPI0011476452|nr:protealysin inhibitor emfourin [Actinomadura sp. WMMA1423]
MLAFTGPDVLVTYERSGGFAGIHRKVSVDMSGTALVNDEKVALGAEEMRGLRDALGRVVTTGSSSQGCQVADHFTYTLAYRGHRATRCLLPSDWRAAVERLEALTGR